MAITPPTTSFLNYTIYTGSYESLLDHISQWITAPRFHLILSINPYIHAIAKRHPDLQSILYSATTCLPDGVGITLAANLLSTPIPHRITGIDLITHLFRSHRFSFYIIGSTPTIHDHFREKFSQEYPNVSILGGHHGYFKDPMPIINDIKDKQPDIILVGTGCPHQERFLAMLQLHISKGVGINVGGSFDVLSGHLKRAPLWMQRCGLEWLFRLIQSPKKIGRLYDSFWFVYDVFKSWRQSKKQPDKMT
tara:strand:- start:5764 stop:6513 length:750 start_codon:yes stop_codon:yes gene_type:complete